jgi:hypothetical protein
VQEKTDGNPFFAIQFFIALAEEGLIDRQGHLRTCGETPFHHLPGEGLRFDRRRVVGVSIGLRQSAARSDYQWSMTKAPATPIAQTTWRKR